MTTPAANAAAQAAASRLPGPQKAALVLLALDEEVAASVISHLSEVEVKQLWERAESLDPSLVSELSPTFREFHDLMKGTGPISSRAAGLYFRDLTIKALGEDRANKIFSPPPPPPPPPGTKIDPTVALQSAKTSALAEVLQEENPQIAAVMVAQLPRERAAEVLAAMDPGMQADVLGRLASLTEIPADAVALASEALARALESAGALGDSSEKKRFDGVTFTAGLLNDIPADDSQRLLSELNERFEKVAPKVRDAMFTFEDLSTLDIKGAQALMKEVQPDQLVIALKTASEDLRELFLGAISSRAAAAMREELGLLPPMRLSEVEAAQRAVVDAAQRLARDGRIQLAGSSKEAMV